eukprot:10675231-Heterocapsa_arctica.AAC.1
MPRIVTLCGLGGKRAKYPGFGVEAFPEEHADECNCGEAAGSGMSGEPAQKPGEAAEAHPEEQADEPQWPGCHS